MHRILAAALAAAVLAGPVAAGPEAERAPRRVVVGGSAEVEAVPDLATITGGVETQAATAAEALAANATAMEAVLRSLAGLGVEARDLQTSQLGIEPVWAEPVESRAAPEVTAYRASNLVTLRLRDVGLLGAAVDAMTKAGANRLHGISFALSDPRPALDAARERAVADARARAELYARAAGVTLGPVLEVREVVDQRGPVMMRAEALSGSAPPVQAGAVAVTAEIEMVFALE